MALITQDQFFELWFPGTYWDRSNRELGGHDTAGARRNARNSPNGSRQFAAAWEAYNRDQIAAENPRSVLDGPYTFNEPAPPFTKWAGPCYDANCQKLRASIEATERANYSSWQTRKTQAEAAEQKRLYEVALLQEADVKAQQYEAEQAAAFLSSEQQRIQQDLVLEQQKIAEQQKQDQANIEAQINASRLAAQEEQANIQAQLNSARLTSQQEQANAEAEFNASQIAAEKERSAIQSQFESDKAVIQEQQIALKSQFEKEKETNEKNIAAAAAETAKQQIITKRQTALQQEAASTPTTKLTMQQNQPAATEQTRRRKTMIGQPGVSSTRVSARSGVGGYGGTAPARVNPTGLNI